QFGHCPLLITRLMIRMLVSSFLTLQCGRARISHCSRGPTPARSRSATSRLARAASACLPLLVRAVCLVAPICFQRRCQFSVSVASAFRRKHLRRRKHLHRRKHLQAPEPLLTSSSPPAPA